MSDRLELVGLTEIGHMLNVTRQRVAQLAETVEFPEPVAEISAGRIWLRQEVYQWARKVGRL